MNTPGLPVGYLQRAMAGLYPTSGLKVAFYLSSGSVGPSTPAYTTAGEVTGGSYVSGGVAVDSSLAPVLDGSGVEWETAAVVAANVTGNVDAAMLYDSNASNANLGVFTFPAQTLSDALLTLGALLVRWSTGTFPLSVSASTQYLQTPAGAPWLVVGDAGWSLTSLSVADLDTYLDAMVARGIDTILFEAIEHKFTAYTPAWQTAAGDVAFSDINDWDTANADYFDHLELCVQQCALRGILCYITPAYCGFAAGNEGWMVAMRANGLTKLATYGAMLGTRFAPYANIVWVHGGDYTAPDTGSPSDLDLVEAIYSGLISTDRGDRLHTAHWAPEASSSQNGPDALRDIDSTYSYGVDADSATIDDRSRSVGVRPIVYIEGYYNHESSVTAVTLRAQIYGPMLAGSAGWFIGSDRRWFFGQDGDGNPGNAFGDGSETDWDASLTETLLFDSQRARTFFESIAWHTLVYSTKTGSGATHSITARYPDHSLYLVYFTASISTTVDLSLINASGDVDAVWFDPTDGSSTPDGSNPYAGTSTAFVTPGTNSAGASDWVLLLTPSP